MHVLHPLGVPFLALLSSGCALSFPDYAGNGGAGGTAGAGGAETGTEDCTNNIDDDNDGLIDCEDTADCGHFISAPEPPLGYKGPVVLSGDAKSFSCEGDWSVATVNGEANIVAKPANCPCTCDAPTGRTCPHLMVTGYTGANCTLTSMGTLTFNNDQCIGAVSPPWNGVISAKIVVDAPTGGTCAVTSTDPPIEDPTIEHRFVCGRNEFGVGKATGEVCVPKPLATAEQRVCVYAMGDVMCPQASVFSERTVLYQSHDDQRKCNKACTCGAPTGGSCTGTITVFSTNGNCANTGSPLPADGACHDKAGFNSQKATIDPPMGSSCSPAIRMPSGQVTGIGPTTVCCTLPL